MSKYIFHSDPGHAWLEVSKAELSRLGIADKISGYSYTNDTSVFLEEDLDAEVFMAAKRAAGGNLDVEELYSENTFIRNLEHYQN